MDELLLKINSKRKNLRHYISKQEPRNKLLSMVAIICGVAGTTLAGIPAIGGTTAINEIKSVTETTLPIWQILCIGAAAFTMLATISTTLRSNNDTANKLSKAQVCDAKLDILELQLKTGQIELNRAIEKYGEYTAEVAFIPSS